MYNILIYIYDYVDLFDLYCYAGTMPRNNPSLLQLAKIGQQLLMILDVWPCRSILCSVSQQLVLVVTFVKVVRGIQLGKIGSKSDSHHPLLSSVVRCWLGHGNRHMYRNWDCHISRPLLWSLTGRGLTLAVTAALEILIGCLIPPGR